HAGQAQVVHIFGAAGDFGAPLEARQRAADLPGAGGHRAHAALPCASPSPSALRTARATNTRTSSFLYDAEPRASAMVSTSLDPASPARWRFVSFASAPRSTASAALRRIGFSVAALTKRSRLRTGGPCP